MNKTRTLAGLACLGLSGFASAALFSPVGGDDSSVTTTGAGITGDTGTWGVGHFVDGSGLATLTASSLHDPSNSGNTGRSLGGSVATFDIDLGGSFTIDGFVLWNGGEDDRPGNGRTVGQRNQTDRGVQTAIVSTSIDGINYISQGTFSFTREFFDESAIPELSPGVPDLDDTTNVVGPIAGQEKFFSGVVPGVTHVRVDVTENWGDGNIVNISEIAFNQIPEPSAALLGSLGLGLLVGRRRR